MSRLNSEGDIRSDVQVWINDDYPEIATNAKDEKAEIQWADETGLSNQASYGKRFAPKGEAPVIPRPATRFSQSMISSLTTQGKLRFMVYDDALNASIFLDFLERLVKGTSRKIFLFVDNLRVYSQDHHRLGYRECGENRAVLPAALRAR